ncbi:epithelial-stromal interaction protein 1 isoform X1 [Tachysurus fulvidraco]|uniref:epithelial-stromal interaction protein 1 isoform X1 n=2 Tax=Tachysurus fulvidraco TaxID=1234273 RepID=UPI001FF02CAC|nr:epithelial-stromal interaction protein 1 isoform X1 [Tachysurus fulvidraco]
MNPNRCVDTGNTGPNRGVNRTQMDGNENYSTDQNTQPQDSRNPRHSDGYTMIPPNESRRSKLLRMSQTEQEDLQRWKEEHRPGPVQLAPVRLGGAVSLSEVRQRQQAASQRSKLQKKLQQEDMDRRKRQAEEEENEMKKAIQRDKANKLEWKKKQEEEERKKLYQHDLLMKREAHLQKLERSSSVPMVASSSTPTSSWARGHEHREARKAEEQDNLQQKKDEQRRKSQILEEKNKQEEEDRKRQMENERLRVNSAFLDRLEARGSGTASESLPCTPELGNFWQMEEPQDPASSPVSFPSQLHTDSAAVEDSDIECVVLKLQSMFPYCEQQYLEEIVSQCNGNYQQAYDLLNS